MTSTPLTNWAGNVVFSTTTLHRPSSVGELQELVAGSSRIRVLGTGHSFNEIADTPGTLLSVAGLPARLEVNQPAQYVTVSAGTRFAELGRALQQAGYALPNTGSLPHISVAGACSTGTHGSGNTLGNLATFVSAVEMVTAESDLVTFSREADPDRFDGMVLALGALGVITTLTLDIVPTFTVRQDVYNGLAHESFLDHFDEVMAAGYSVSVFSTWRSPWNHQILIKSRTEPADTSPAAPTLYGAALATAAQHPVAEMSAEYVTQQLGIPGPWNERLPHFKVEFTPSAGEEIQSEYLLPREDAVPALRALEDITEDIAAVLQIGEIRTTAADELWLSPSHQRATVCLHFTWIKDEAAIAPVVKAIEQRLAAFDARPHWGKRFTVSPSEIARLYPRLDNFRRLMQTMDPAGKFRNEMIDRLIAGSPATAHR